ncbi:hypothetical protein SEA_EDEN_6 [Microbacterium phage Eden]|uniref:Uncharacterized protein n=1 Tax=Microbacterium phage Eden TaxID=2250289 RepID=A0A345KW99_9CAUD|nr:hypothetical protein HOT71_gp06 [Microbacterium phage Eden]AXH47301.1 hypothetical protein SEA_EDEN_6 [Microbacterium phage Eden]
MALKEYRFPDGTTHLFDEDDAPKGAELVGDIAPSVSPGSFDELVMAAHDARGRKGRRRAANKAAPAPENKDEAEDNESDDESEDAPEGAEAGDSAE